MEYHNPTIEQHIKIKIVFIIKYMENLQKLLYKTKKVEKKYPLL